MQRYPQAYVHKSVPVGMSRKVSDEDDIAGSADVFEQVIGAETERVTGRIDAPAYIEESHMVSPGYAARAVLQPKPECVLLPYPISANRYFRNFRGRMVISSEARAYKKQVAWTFTALGIEPASGDVSLTVKLHPKLTKTGVASRTLIDLDNALKVVFDALQGVLYVNDRQIKKLRAEVGEPVDGGGLSVGLSNV